jgi:hypothetical protein
VARALALARIMDDLDAPPLMQLQKLVSLTLPPIIVCVILRGIACLCIKVVLATGRRVSRRFGKFVAICNRIDRAGQIAGKTSYFLSLLIAFSGLREVWREGERCMYATSPRPHALFMTASVIGLVASIGTFSNALNVGALAVFARRNPLAYMLSTLGLLEWLNPHGFALECAMVTSYATTTIAATSHVNACGKMHASSDALMITMGYAGIVAWSATLSARTVAERRWQRAATVHA